MMPTLGSQWQSLAIKYQLRHWRYAPAIQVIYFIDAAHPRRDWRNANSGIPRSRRRGHAVGRRSRNNYDNIGFMAEKRSNSAEPSK